MSSLNRYTGRLVTAAGNGITRVTDRALGPYQSAIIRIGFCATWLLFLLREFPHRRELYGPDGPWSWELAQRLITDNDAFTILMWSDSMVWFEIVYAATILSTVLLLLGWRTRAMSVLFMVGVLSLQNRSVFMGDGGDNVIHLMAIYLVFVRCAQVWSLDARRARRVRERLELDGGAREDVVGPVLWCVLGFALLVSTFGGLIPGGLLGWRPANHNKRAPPLRLLATVGVKRTTARESRRYTDSLQIRGGMLGGWRAYAGKPASPADRDAFRLRMTGHPRLDMIRIHGRAASTTRREVR